MNKKIPLIIISLIVTGAAAYYYFKPTAPAIISEISDIERKNRDALAAQLAQKHSQIATKDIVTTIDLGEIESKLHKAFTSDLTQAEKLLLELFGNNAISRFDKGKIALNLIENLGLNTQQAQMIMDFLDIIKPIEHASKLVNWLHRNMDDVSRKHLFSLIKNTYQINFSPDLPAEIRSQIHGNTELLHTGVKNYIYDTNAPNNARLNALEIYSGISSTAENSQVVNDILTANIKFDLANKAPGSLEYFIATSMTGNKEGIQNLMPSVLKALNENKNNPKLAIDMNDFVGRMSIYLQRDQTKQVSTILQDFTPQNYQEMIDFFEKNPIDTSKFNPDTDVFYASANYQMTLNQLKYGKDNWVKPYIEILKKEENPEKIAGLLMKLGVDNKVYAQLDNITKQEKKEILLKEKANIEATYTKDILSTMNTPITHKYRAINDALYEWK
jgi:hypothetical protein